MEVRRMIPIFIGYDPREAATFHVLEQSIINRTTSPVAIIPLHSPMLDNFDGQQDGTNAFIYSRFLVPEMMDYHGWAIYMDSDMLLFDDLTKLFELTDETKAVMVVKHDYKTTRNTKFVGTPLECKNEDYPRKNWSSLILWNCGHERNRILTRKFVSEAGGRVLHRFSWMKDEHIGEIHQEWNHLVGEYTYAPWAKNVHFTLGAPGFRHYRDCDYSEEWHKQLTNVNNMIGEVPEGIVRRASNGF